MEVFAYDFDLESGSISNKRLLVDRRATYGEPDGMVVEYVPLALSLKHEHLLNASSLVPPATSGLPATILTE